ncbi:MAG: EAL domain-containing protein [Actinobacteria bacterium]|jgi:PAS domain S-box-containing protein/diguanylate cyclase (GGDEF)-like protein|nr:EAL domain-containing protein [Actinomycetota bacterium]
MSSNSYNKALDEDLFVGLNFGPGQFPLQDYRFWLYQGQLAGILTIYLLTNLAYEHRIITVPDFVWLLLLLLPVITSVRVFGMVGALGIASEGILGSVIILLSFAHSNGDIWGASSILAIVFIVAVLLGNQVERERSARKTLAESEQRFRLAFQSSGTGMVLLDLEDRILQLNSAFCEMLGYSSDQLVGKTSEYITHPDDKHITGAAQQSLISGESEDVHYRKRFLRSDGQVVYAEVCRSLARSYDGTPLYVVSSIRDITAERSLLEQLSHHSLHDPLTDLPNRIFLEDRLDKVQAQIRHYGGQVVLFLLDLRRFREVNEALGHRVGDELLVKISQRLLSTIASSGTLCRPSGDRFAYLSENLASLDEVDTLARRLLGAFEEPFQLGRDHISQSASMGAVVCTEGTKDSAELLQYAELALYEAKRQGKGSFVLFDPQMYEDLEKRYQLSQELGRALGQGEITMYYQPIVDLATGSPVGFEALMRWRHKEMGFIPPDRFIPLAEQSELIYDLGAFALSHAALTASSWQTRTEGSRTPFVTVNLSVHQFLDQELLNKIEQALRGSGLDPSQLVIEITESTSLAETGSGRKIIEGLRSLGVQVALDDFGTGYSSLSYLTSIHPTMIKIDRVFVTSSATSHYDQRLLEAIVSMGHGLDVAVVAEGIETAAQLDRLRSIGCDLGQGYLFSPAVPVSQIDQMLE